MTWPRPCVVDTNVLVVGNARSNASPSCVIECVKAMDTIRARGHLVLDNGNEIFDEYRRHASLSGQPGIGDAFVKWVHDHRYNAEFCALVRITRTSSNPDDFAEFPRDRSLRGFDPSDRKFVAVAVAHGGSPPIFQAADSKWWRYRDALNAAGIVVEFLCPEDLSASDKRKSRRKRPS